jgi:hypothetical protein
MADCDREQGKQRSEQMRAERLEIIHRRLLWLLIITFSVAWGATAALADDVKSVWISGATSVNDGASVQLKAYAQTGSETKDITTESNNKWALSSTTYASITRGRLTTKEVPGCQTKKVTVTISYARDGVTKTDSHEISIVDNECGASTPPPPTLQGISLGGPTSMDENTAADFPVTATLSDGTSKSVTAVLTENSAYASLSGIRLTVTEVTSNQVVSVGASYTEGGVTKTTSKSVQIIDKTTAPAPVTLQSISIGGPSSLNENASADFPVTATMSNGTNKSVTASMTENSPYAAFSGVRLTATEVSGNQAVGIAASYTEGGLTRTASKVITIVDTTAAPPPVQGSHAGRFDTYAGATTCLPCHRPQAVQVYKSEHYQWAGKFGAINDFCIYPDINTIGKLTNVYGNLVDGGCLKCHPGLGAKPTTAATPTDADLANIDCLVCHAPSYKRTVDPVTKTNYIPDEQAMGMTILEAAADIRPTSRDTCLNCHTKSGGGNNFKRGDIEEHHRNPATREFDVHMSSAALGGGEMHCTQCHTVSAHKIAGRGVDLRVEEGTKPDCTTCHTTNPPHSNTNINRYHVNRVHCATCHIPAFAKNAPTDVFRDWGAHGELNTTTGLYDPARIMQANVTPQYKFWDGKTSVFYNFGSAATVQANGNVLMAGPGAASPAIAGAKIHPFKVHTASQPIDAVTDFLLPLKIGRFYMEGDLVNAIPLGQDGVGWPRNAYGYQGTERWMGVFHEVAPKERALAYNSACTTCHGGTAPKMDLKAMGYTAKKPTTDLCNDCHGSKSYSFNEVHPRHTNKGYDCSACHTFSRAK